MKIIVSEMKNNEGINVSCSKYNIVISKESEDWNNEGINKFLVNIATSITDDDLFEIEEMTEEQKNNPTFVFVWELFKNFIEEYNLENNKENN